jgi:hypothetical protein
LPRAALGLSRLQQHGALAGGTASGRALRILDLLVRDDARGVEEGAAQLWRVLAELRLVPGFGSARAQLRPLR